MKSAILNAQRASAIPYKPGMAPTNWFSAKASTPVPIVTANQFGVNWRTISDIPRPCSEGAAVVGRETAIGARREMPGITGSVFGSDSSRESALIRSDN